MKVKTNKLERLKPIRIFYLFLIILMLGAMLFYGHNSFLKLAKQKAEVAKLEKKVNLLKAQNDSLMKENNELKTNPEVIEKIAREKLGYQKPGEKVIRFLPPAEDETEAAKQRR